MVIPDHLHGFFQGWPTPPSLETHFNLLEKSDHFVLAIDDENARVVGFITAITDDVLSSYISFIEVLPTYQKRGIGSELIRRMLQQLGGLYMVDLLCDPELKLFYECLGMSATTGMMLRNYEHQSGEKLRKLSPGE